MQPFEHCFAQFQTVIAQLANQFGVPATDCEIRKIKPHCHVEDYAAGEHLVEPTKLCQNNFFIITGLVRFYYLTEDGKFHNKSFSHENQFAGSIQSSLFGADESHLSRLRYYVQALEPTVALAVNVAKLNSLYRESLFWANVGRIHGESLALRKQRREEQFLLDSAEIRYQTFLEDYPELAGRLPLYHIASYLGITDVALSRIRKRLESSEINSAS